MLVVFPTPLIPTMTMADGLDNPMGLGMGLCSTERNCARTVVRVSSPLPRDVRTFSVVSTPTSAERRSASISSRSSVESVEERCSTLVSGATKLSRARLSFSLRLNMGGVYRKRGCRRAAYADAWSRCGAGRFEDCLLYTSDAADERSSVDLGGRRIIK